MIESGTVIVGAHPLFQLGRLVATPGALEALKESGESPLDFVRRHVVGDWGDCHAHDAQLNQRALTDGSRIFSVYRTRRCDKLWVITGATCDESPNGRRQSTCVLLPEEY